MTMPATARTKRWVPAEFVTAGSASRLSTVPSRTAAGSNAKGRQQAGGGGNPNSLPFALMVTSAKKTKRPAGLNGLIAFQDEPRPIPLRTYKQWVPYLRIAKYERKRDWTIELDPFEGSLSSKYLTPLGAAVASTICHLGDGIFNSSLGFTSHHIGKNGKEFPYQYTSVSYMQFSSHSLEMACTIASRLLCLPEECYTNLPDNYLPSDPIQRILIISQRDSGTDIKPMPWDAP